MSIETHQALLVGFEDLHVGLRAKECECGCGTVFWHKVVGRPPKYLNAAHKARAYRAGKVNKTSSVKGLFSARLQEMLDNANNPVYWPDEMTDAMEGFVSLALSSPRDVIDIIELAKLHEAGW